MNQQKQKPSTELVFYTEICGGLGNQLFQLFALFSLALTHQREAVVLRSESSPSILKNRNVYWNTMFQNVLTTAKKPRVDYVHNDIDAIRGFEPIVFPTEFKDTSYVHGIQLKGYYQHRRHFWKHRSALISKLLPPESVWKTWAPLSTMMTKYPLQSLAFMHFRRGDYKTLAHVHCVLPLQYYENAMKMFGTSVQFLLFCEGEDLGVITQEVERSPVLHQRVIIDPEIISKVPDYQQLYLMSACGRGGILANSTFSVWAAYLHSAKTGIFTYPDTFFTSHPRQTISIFDPTWIKIPCSS